MKIIKSSKNTKDVVKINSNISKYNESVKYIEAAIKCLAQDASNDDLAKEAITNLGVVLFELK